MLCHSQARDEEKQARCGLSNLRRHSTSPVSACNLELEKSIVRTNTNSKLMTPDALHDHYNSLTWIYRSFQGGEFMRMLSPRTI